MWVPVAVWQPCELLYTCYLLTYLLTYRFPALFTDTSEHKCKKAFFTFFYFPLSRRAENVGKVQSGKQINKKRFHNNSNEINLWFFCCMSNDLKCLPINFYLLTMFDALCYNVRDHEYWRFHCWPKKTTVSAKQNWMAYSELPWRPFLGH